MFEDDALLVVDKPAGVLSQPGKTVDGSVATQVREMYPHATGPLLVHRLDMDTSGLLVLAKNREVHRALQQQFEKREVDKRYTAIVQGRVAGLGGRIALPLRLDIEQRPAQMVCRQFGKSAVTLWRPVAVEGETTRLMLQALTGRTHQLRVHLADQRGLGLAIVGDRLYGKAAQRMLLHADRLAFTHPTTGLRHQVASDAPF